MQGVTPVNTDNLSIVRRSISVAEKPVLLTHSEIEALVRQEMASAASLDWKPPYPAEVAGKTYSSDYKVHMF